MNYLDYSIIGVYLIGLLTMGFFIRQRANKQDYFLGGRVLGWQPLALSIMATQLSAISFVSAPAFVGLRDGGGLKWLTYELALPLAMLLLLSTLLPIIYRSGVVSIYEFLERRFDRSSRLLLSLVFQISRSFATGIMVYAISIILQGTTGLAFWQSIALIAGVTLVYSLQGGMKAVVYGDAIQFGLIILGALICLAFGLHLIGGWEQFVILADPARLDVIDFSSTGLDGEGFGFWPMVFGGLVLYASYYGCDQSEAQRSLSAKNVNDLKKMIIAASVVRFPITLLYCTMGLVIGTFAFQTPEFMSQIPADRPDWMMPLFIINYLPNGMIGLLLIAIMAAAMSSLSSAINSLSAVSVEDYCRLTQKTLSDQAYMGAARWAGLFWGSVTILISIFAGDIAPTVIEAINKVGSVFYGPVLACFVLGTMSKSLVAKQVNVGLIVGVMTNLTLWLSGVGIFWFWWNLIGFIVTVSVAYLAFSLTTSTPRELRSIDEQPESIVGKPELMILIGWFVLILLVCINIPALFS